MGQQLKLLGLGAGVPIVVNVGDALAVGSGVVAFIDRAWCTAGAGASDFVRCPVTSKGVSLTGMASAKGQVELVLFDLGGVLVRLGGIGAMQGLASTAAEEEVWDGRRLSGQSVRWLRRQVVS